MFKKTYSTCLMDHTIMSRYDLSNKNFSRFQSWESIGENMSVSAQVLKFWNEKPKSVDTDMLKITSKAYRCDGTDEYENHAAVSGTCTLSPSSWTQINLPICSDRSESWELQILCRRKMLVTTIVKFKMFFSPGELLSASQNDIVKFCCIFQSLSTFIPPGAGRLSNWICFGLHFLFSSWQSTFSCLPLSKQVFLEDVDDNNCLEASSSNIRYRIGTFERIFGGSTPFFGRR
jgi:hypothetical protein